MEWRKSSYSGATGNCVEVALNWRKSSFSYSNGGDCVEVAETPETVNVRDSQHPALGQLTFPAAEWRAFIEAAKREQL